MPQPDRRLELLRVAAAYLRHLEAEVDDARRRRTALAAEAAAAGIDRVEIAAALGLSADGVGRLLDGEAWVMPDAHSPPLGWLRSGARAITLGEDGLVHESASVASLSAPLGIAAIGCSAYAEWSALVHDDDVASVAEAVNRAALGAATSVAYRVVGDDGVARWVRERLRRRERHGSGSRVVDGLIEQLLEPPAEATDERAGVVVMRIARLMAQNLAQAEIATQATEIIAEAYDLARLTLVLDDGSGRVVRFGGRERVSSDASETQIEVRGGDGGAMLLVRPRRGCEAPDLSSASEMTGLVLQCVESRDRHARGATTDDLTGLPNRRQLDEWLAAACAQARATGEPVALALLDIDHFKRVNDLNGHPAGDEVLRRAARTLADGLVEGQRAARVGGEEFAILMPATDETAAVEAADRLRAAISAADFAGIGRVTMSAGIGAGREAAVPAELYASADAALYAAKRSGRDRTRAFGRLTDADLVLLEPEPVRTAQVLVLAACVSAQEGLLPLHNERVGELAAETASALGLDPAVVLRCRLAGLLHDVGKIAVPLELLGRRGPLDERERNIVRRHVDIGADLVSRVNDTADCAPVIRHHLEHYDGTGHPDGLASMQIPIESRIVAAASLFATLVDERPYAPAISWQEAIDELRAAAGSQLDPEVVAATIDVLHRRHAAIGLALERDRSE